MRDWWTNTWVASICLLWFKDFTKKHVASEHRVLFTKKQTFKTEFTPATL